MSAHSTNFGPVCPRCGQAHGAFRLRAGQHAACVQCGTILRKPSQLGPHAVPALAATALVLAIPATMLPIVTLSKLGDRHATFLTSSADGLTRGGLPYLAALVFACVVIAPVMLAGLLITWWLFSRSEKTTGVASRLRRALEFFQHWAMPEVFVLGVLIAFVKLDQLAHVIARPGLWCYAAMAVAVLWAWRTFALQFRSDAGDTGSRDHP